MKEKHYKKKIIWKICFVWIILHLVAVYTFFALLPKISLRLFITFTGFGLIMLLGVNIGTHRMWCHRSFKAKLSLRFLLMITQTFAFQKDIYKWCREHRQVKSLKKIF